MNLRHYILIIILSVFTNSYASTVSSDLAGMLNSVHTMRANFTQTVYDNRDKPVLKSVGKMAMERPGKFRWDVTKPIPQLVIANDTRLWIYDADLEQVTIRSIKYAAGEAPALLLSHVNTDIEKDFSVKAQTKKTPGWSWFTLVPKKPDSMFASIQMGFTKNEIHEMRLEDHLGHNTVIQFNNIETNVSLSSSLFAFKAKKNVDVIDETHKHR